MRTLAAKAVRGIRWRPNALLRNQATATADRTSSHVVDVSNYYDRFTGAYLKTTGPFIQAFRGTNTDALMRYYVERCGISDGMELLDAGCGVGAPAIWLARRFPELKVECLTVSAVQAEAAVANAREAGVSDRVAVTLGDFHQLAKLYPQRCFDQVLFLESLGHSDNIRAVLSGVHAVLKAGGRGYIKDFFQRPSPNHHLREQVARAVAAVNTNYCYRVMQLPDMVAACLEVGFRIASLQPPAIEPDLGLTIAFEHEVGRLTYPTYAQFAALDWYEIVVERE